MYESSLLQIWELHHEIKTRFFIQSAVVWLSACCGKFRSASGKATWWTCVVLCCRPGRECLATLPGEVISERASLRVADRNACFLVYFLSLTLWLPSSWDAIQDEYGCLQLLLAICCGEGRDCIPSSWSEVPKVIVFPCYTPWSEGYVKSSPFPQACCREKRQTWVALWGTSAWLFSWGKEVLWIKH